MIKNNRSTPPFVLAEIGMLRDPEFLELSLAAKMLWIFLRREFNPYNPECKNPITGQDQVYLSYSKLKKINGFKSAATISKAIKELINKNWIVVAEQGGLYAGRSAYVFVGKYAPFPNKKKVKKQR